MPRGAAAVGGTPGLRLMPPGAMLMRRASASVGARDGRPVCSWAGKAQEGSIHTLIQERRLLCPACPPSSTTKSQASIPTNRCHQPPSLLPGASPAPPRRCPTPWWTRCAAPRPWPPSRTGSPWRQSAASTGSPVAWQEGRGPFMRGCTAPQQSQPFPQFAIQSGSNKSFSRPAEISTSTFSQSNPRPHLHRLGLGVHVDKHERLAAAAQARLQQVRELGVAVRDVPALGGQRLRWAREWRMQHRLVGHGRPRPDTGRHVGSAARRPQSINKK